MSRNNRVFAFVLTVAVLSAAADWPRAGAAPPQGGAPAACVPIGSPRRSATYFYKYSDSTGSMSEYNHQWQEFSATATRMILTRTAGLGRGESTYEGRHHIGDDVLFLEFSKSYGSEGGVEFQTQSTFTPAVIGDPVKRACPGTTWDIPSVSVAVRSNLAAFTRQTDRGTLKIVAVRESVTVPAGTFDTVHYTKVMTTAAGQQRDEFWKSLEHGVTVKRTGTQPGATSTETLIAIR